MIDPNECWGCRNLMYTAYGFTCNRSPRICAKDKSVTITWTNSTSAIVPPSTENAIKKARKVAYYGTSTACL